MFGAFGGRKDIRALSVLAAATTLQVVSAQPAWADSMAIEAIGRIPALCDFALTADFPAADFSQPGYLRAYGELTCNSGFVVKATSANGAVVNTVPAPTGFGNRLDYRLLVNVPLDSGGRIRSVCRSPKLVAGGTGCPFAPGGNGASSGGEPATRRKVTLLLRWWDPPQPLVAGSYSDTITISIAAKP